MSLFLWKLLLMYASLTNFLIMGRALRIWVTVTVRGEDDSFVPADT